jgi:hypothetical protein
VIPSPSSETARGDGLQPPRADIARLRRVYRVACEQEREAREEGMARLAREEAAGAFDALAGAVGLRQAVLWCLGAREGSDLG